MIFRPLCIDYRSRAQEVYAVERDAQARSAASRLLPHPHRRDGSSQQDECYQHVSTTESMTGQDENQNCSNMNKVDDDRSNSHRRLTSKSPSLQTIYQLLGPAVHPSECAFRNIEPVTKGPIRGKKQIVNVKPVLQELVAEHDRIMEGKFRGGVVSLDSGCSRFDFAQLVMEEKEERDVLYSPNIHSAASDQSNYAMDTITPTKSSTSSSPMFIRHQPPNLTRICQLKSLRARDPVLFGDILSNMFQPELKSLSEGDLSDSWRGNSARRGCFPGPTFDLNSICGVQTNYPDYSSRSTLVSFANFSELDSKEDTSDGPSNIRKHSAPSNVLESLDDSGFCFLRTDPDLPRIDEGLMKIERKDIDVLLNKSLDGLSSASFILNKLTLPNRFEDGHDLVQDSSCFLVSVKDPQFKLLDVVAMEQHKHDSPSFVSCLKFIESGDIAGSRTFLPRKISLESSIKIFDEVETSEERRPNTMEMLSRLSSFSSQFSFAPNLIEKGRTFQRCHVKSTARVSETRSLQNVIGDNATAYLFLPQIDVNDQTKATQDYSRKRPPTEEDAIIDFVRSCVPSANAPRDIQLLKQHKTDYPIKHWFAATKMRPSNGTRSLPSNEINAESDLMPDDIRQEMNKLKRSAFCEKAQTANREETQRNLIITGCSARRNAGAIYSYRGILTNSPLDPKLYQDRYALMLDMQKTNRLKYDASRSSFVHMTQGIIVSSLLRDGKRKKRGAQLADRLRTRRHKTLEVSLEDKHEHTQLETHNAMKLTSIASMASSARKENPAMAGSVEKLGKTLKQERGELLHLVSKADELEKEERAYVEELAVLNRHAKTMKEDLFDFAIESDEKRKVPTEHGIEEDYKKKQKKKKPRKRDETAEERTARRAKKKKLKERRKRKSECDRNSVEDTSDVSKRAKFLDTGDANATRVLSVAPSLQLGITPIMPPKQQKVLQQPNTAHDKSGDNVVLKNAVGSIPASHKIKDSTLLSVLKNSPDSVASLNEGRKLLFSQRKGEIKMSCLNTHQETDDDVELLDEKPDGQIDDVYIEHTKHNDDQESEIPVLKGFNCGKPALFEVETEVATMTLLSSESFLEEYSEVITALATGAWNKSLARHEKNNVVISIFDCPLVDFAGVDMELSSGKGVIVNRLSSWLKGDQQKTSRAFIRRLVSLAASGRYKCLHVILCMDTDVSFTLANEISTLQNALVQQSGCRCEVTFEFVKPQVLPATLGISLYDDLRLNQTQGGGISDSIMNENTVERARFLMMLVPSMTVHMALGCLGCCENLELSKDSGHLLCDLLCLAMKKSRSDFVKNTSTVLSDIAAHQLWLVMHTDLSNGH